MTLGINPARTKDGDLGSKVLLETALGEISGWLQG